MTQLRLLKAPTALALCSAVLVIVTIVAGCARDPETSSELSGVDEQWEAFLADVIDRGAPDDGQWPEAILPSTDTSPAGFQRLEQSDLDALQWTSDDFFWNQSISEDVLQLHRHIPALPNWPLTKTAVQIHSVQAERGDVFDELRWGQNSVTPGDEAGRHGGWVSLTVPIKLTETSIQAINGTLHVAVAARVSRHTFEFGPSAPRVRVKIGEQTAYVLLAEPDFVVGRWPRELYERCTLAVFDDRGERIKEGQWFSFGEDEVFYTQRFERPVTSVAVLEGHDYIERQIEFSAKHRTAD